MKRINEHWGEENPFGAGMDLIVSLFAMLLIMIAVGIHYYRELKELGSFFERQAFSQVILEITGEESKKNNVRFDKSKVNLSKKDKKELAAKKELLLQLLLTGRANQINIIGYASPEPFSLKSAKKCPPEDKGKFYKTTKSKQTESNIDLNLNLSALRAAEAAHYLNYLGVPYNCLTIMGVGRSRSSSLNQWLQDSSQEIEDWDNHCAYKNTKPQTLAAERKVELVAVNDYGSRCAISPKDFSPGRNQH